MASWSRWVSHRTMTVPPSLCPGYVCQVPGRIWHALAAGLQAEIKGQACTQSSPSGDSWQGRGLQYRGLWTMGSCGPGHHTEVETNTNHRGGRGGAAGQG